MARVDRGDGRHPAAGCLALSDTDTIVALSSGAPPAAVAVIRLSGPIALDIARLAAGRLPPPRHAAVRGLRVRSGELLDRALVLVFPGPGSSTGEDLVEFHCHGGRAVIAAVERALIDYGSRRAVAGEFTRRALLNGRIDLAQAQGLADLLSAQSEAERRFAVAAAEGVVSRAVHGWLERMTAMAANLEASIDFAEDGDVVSEATSLPAVIEARDVLIAEMTTMLASPPVERWREGWRVVVVGPPNAGKSTLVNLLSSRDVSIVSAQPGTTRDRVEVTVERQGIGYVLIDTAGIRLDAQDPIEQMGIDRAQEAAASADVLLWVDDAAPEGALDRTIWIHARADAAGRDVAPVGAIAVSRLDPRSVERLWDAISDRTVGSMPTASFALHRNERDSCLRAVAVLRTDEHDAVILAENLRAARREIGGIIGIDATEVLLDQIFSRFCLGK